MPKTVVVNTSIADFQRIMRHAARSHTFIRDNDRSTVILAGAWLDELLKQLLEKRFRPSRSASNNILENGVLSSFSSRTDIAHRIGLIDNDMARGLDLVRRIRNDFAHNFEADTLGREPHAARVRELAAPFISYAGYETFFARASLWKRHKGAAADFRVAVAVLATQLHIGCEVAEGIASPGLIPMIPRTWEPAATKPKRRTPTGRKPK